MEKKVVNRLSAFEEWMCVVVFLTIVCTLTSGCGTQAGWRFSVGVSPVTAINDQQSLTPVQEAENGK